MTTALAQRGQELHRLCEVAKQRFTNVLGNEAVATKFSQLLVTSVQKSPALAACKPISIIGCALELASLGLSPDQQLGEAYMVPYKDQAQLQIGYKGLLVLAERASGLILKTVQVVRDGDQFVHVRGLDERLEHRIGEKRGNLTHAYVVAEYPDLRKVCESMTLEEILLIKKRSPASRISGSIPS